MGTLGGGFADGIRIWRRGPQREERKQEMKGRKNERIQTLPLKMRGGIPE